MTLIDRVDILNALTLTNGIIDANTADIRLGTTAFVIGGSNVSHVDGFISKEGNSNFSFPVGDNGIYQYLRIIDISSSSTFRVSYTDEAHPEAGAYYDGNANASITEEIGNCDHWDVEQVIGTGTANVVVSYGNNSCNVIPPAGEPFMSMAVWDGFSWNYPLPGVDPTSVSGEVATTTPLTDFGGVVLASNDPSSNILPIELLVFHAEAKEKSVLTSWSTASEINNDYFVVERSRNAVNFFEVGRIEGAGDSNVQLNYQLLDRDPYTGLSYYRLKQVDYDGAFTYSETVAVQFDGASGISLDQAYLCEAGLCIAYRAEHGPLNLTLHDITGRLIVDHRISAESNFITIPFDAARGIYLVSLSNGFDQESIRIFY